MQRSRIKIGRDMNVAVGASKPWRPSWALKHYGYGEHPDSIVLFSWLDRRWKVGDQVI